MIQIISASHKTINQMMYPATELESGQITFIALRTRSQSKMCVYTIYNTTLLLLEWIFTILFTQRSQFIFNVVFITFFAFRRIWMNMKLSWMKKTESLGRCKECRYMLHRFIRVNPSFYLVCTLLSSTKSMKYGGEINFVFCFWRFPGVQKATPTVASTAATLLLLFHNFNRKQTT